MATTRLPLAFSAIIFETSQCSQEEVLMEPLWTAISIAALVVIMVLLLVSR